MLSHVNSPKQVRIKVFLSYARKDLHFVDRLASALASHGIETLIDRAEIFAFEEWWKRIETLIASSDTVVFVISPAAVSSMVCQKEIAFAASLNKRFAPILYEPVENALIPDALKQLNFIFFDNPSQFQSSADRLVEAFVTDIHWIRRHTEFGEAARRWGAEGERGDSLLRASRLEQAEQWIATRPNGAPVPSDETLRFIRMSRQATSRRRSVAMGALGLGLVLALALAGLAYWQRGVAREQENLAKEERDVAENRRIETLAQVATSARLLGNQDRGLRLAVHAARLNDQHRRKNAGRSVAPWALSAAVWQSDWRRMLGGPKDPIRTAAFDPTASKIVTTAEDNVVRIWTVSDGSLNLKLEGHDSLVKSAAFSPDGARVVTASDDTTARVWDAKTGKQLLVLRGHTDWVKSAVFDASGSMIVTGSQDKTARVWDAETGRQVSILLGHGDAITSAAFSKDASLIVTASWDGTARIWDAVTGKQISTLEDGQQQLSVAAFNRDGSKVITAGRVSAHIWDVHTAKQVAELGHVGPINSAVFSSDGSRIVTGADDRTVGIWDVKTGKAIGALHGTNGIVETVAFADNGLILSAGNDYVARIWEAKPVTQIAPRSRISVPATFAVMSPDGARIITASENGAVRIWNSDMSRQIGVLSGHDGSVKWAAFSPDGAIIVTASDDKTARLWDTESTDEISVLKGHTSAVNFVAFSHDGTRVVTASDDKTVRIWDIKAAKSIGRLFSTTLGSGENTMIVQSASGDERVLGARYEEMNTAVFSPDDRRIVTASDATRIWDTETLNQIKSLAELSSPTVNTRWSRVIKVGENSMASIGSRRTARLHGLQIVNHAAVSPDGSLIVTGLDDDTAQVWNATTYANLGVLRGHESDVNFVAFSADGARIATASSTVRVWDTESLLEIAVIAPQGSSVRSVAFSPNGRYVLIASGNGPPQILDVHFATMATTDLIDEVCLRRLRGFTVLTRDEMRLAGYSDSTPEIDVCSPNK
jgi:WD40 repeat protein